MVAGLEAGLWWLHKLVKEPAFEFMVKRVTVCSNRGHMKLLRQ